jgi:hypothetical protein
MISASLIFAIASYGLMLLAYFWHRKRKFHIPVMVLMIVIDLFFPIYLVLTKDWYRRLIEEGEILSFMVWMHFILVLVLYALYFLQIMTARKLLAGDVSARAEHHNQGKGILITRLLVILSASMLIESVKQG